ncbi:copper homeostasis protein CutC [Romboutsia sp. 1001216sp1]|uniref:copper homeostasis protein CutC n=1 Tax=Romboutsia sp. 1001216sp1 TaxID=2986997 RepID=UPI00232C3A4C|nr:copper homeostasis protein CutC [Romboutsia sp. 1001216sp1]MDB8806271.1 copper homeostasis protein CutC [Romboutsia sp. 1001216sp1]MDB8809008.1 copper homeostasis protein CutC [Romboutsia sp. 1001216sp1]MDB8811919.1 copper homeostasis protein CutC [Romboutsia sp. 1001216sp1]MDB8817665.1 copper homeostasis protein CutC [Romboutsia sp. 1001216sp1]MDB8820447.1 copper homeostasis protein CutC [Romboutsia sp. 1001216sp1]
MLEIIGMSVEDAKTIEACGGDRIELISALTEGGLTPSFATIEKVVNNVNIPVNVMIRNHENSFVYSEYDIEIMEKDIEIAKSLGVNGVVLGLLDKENNIDEVNLQRLLKKCKGIDVTFHKAIDFTNVIKSTEILNKYNITNILTAGGTKRIDYNIEKIKSMIEVSKDINILLGGGLNFENINTIKESTNATDYHFGTAIRIDNSPFGRIDENKLKELIKIIK